MRFRMTIMPGQEASVPGIGGMMGNIPGLSSLMGGQEGLILSTDEIVRENMY